MSRCAPAFLLCVGVLGCTPEGSLGRDYPAETSTSTMAGTSHGETTTSTESSSSDTSSDGSSESGHHGTSTDTGTTTGGHDACAPAGVDDACATCTKTSCCGELSACVADPTCTCVHECHAAGTPLATCTARCGDDGGLNDALESCTHTMCTPPCA